MSEVQVTDHAVIRYLERVAGFDIDGLRAALARSAAFGQALGASVVVIDGGKLVISGDRIVTVLRRDQPTLLRGQMAAVEVDYTEPMRVRRWRKHRRRR